MTPYERKAFDREIYYETKKPEYRGCIAQAADYLHYKYPDRVSRLINPTDTRAHNIFSEVVLVIKAFYQKHPKLAKFIWRKIVREVNAFMDAGDRTVKLAQLAEKSDRTAREQLDVNSAVSLGKPAREIQKEAWEALLHSQEQYRMAMELTDPQTQVFVTEQ